MKRNKTKYISYILFTSLILSLGSCNQNDEKATITSWGIPDKYKQERTDEKGQVVEVTYSTKDQIDFPDKQVILSKTTVQTCFCGPTYKHQRLLPYLATATTQ